MQVRVCLFGRSDARVRRQRRTQINGYRSGLRPEYRIRLIGTTDICKTPPFGGVLLFPVCVDTGMLTRYNCIMETEETVGSVASKYSFYILTFTAILTPVFFIPGVPLSFAKVFFIAVGVFTGLIFWIVGRLKHGSIPVPFNPTSVSLGLLAVFLFLSAVFSGNFLVSFFDSGFEIGTFSFFFLLVLAFFMSSFLFRTTERVYFAYAGILISALAVFLFQVVRVFFSGSGFSLDSFLSGSGNIIGSWKDFGFFFGAVSVLSVSALETAFVKRNIKIFLSIVLVLSLVMLVVADIRLIWITLAGISLQLGIYKMFFAGYKANGLWEKTELLAKPKEVIPFYAIGVFAISVVFIINGSVVSQKAVRIFSVDSQAIAISSAHLSWHSTYNLTKETLKNNPVLGVGPNMFVSEWVLRKPQSINITPFWNTSFNFASGFVPTFIVTGGIASALLFAVFLVSFIFLGFKVLFSPTLSGESRFFSVSSFLAGIFLWTMAIFQVPGAPILFLTFLFSGIFVGISYGEKFLKKTLLSFKRDPKIGFVLITFLVLLVIASTAYIYVWGKHLVATAFFEKGVKVFNQNGDLVLAEKNIHVAMKISQNDIFYRTMAELALVKMNNLISDTGLSSFQAQEDFRSLLVETTGYAKSARDYNRFDYLNWLALGRVYEAILPLKIYEGAFADAKSSYEKAFELNPTGPQIYLAMARLHVAEGDLVSARVYADMAYSQKSDYAEAVFLKSQIDVREGKSGEAIKNAEEAAKLSPNDSAVHFQIGLLKYDAKDYAGAVGSLQKALLLEPKFANAKYFLGLSYYHLGRVDEAKAEFADILKIDPFNKEVKKIISNLEEGKEPI